MSSSNLSQTDDILAELGISTTMPTQKPTTIPVVQNPPAASAVMNLSEYQKPSTVAPASMQDPNASQTISNLPDNEIITIAIGGVAKLQAIESEINTKFVERDSVIKDLIRAILVGQHMLLLGPPGTAKSAMAREICSRIEMGIFFEWLLNRTSDPAEILGPYSIKSMEQDKFLRKMKGKLPEAHIAFLDEIYKSNEPTLNILLPLLNERLVFNDGKAIKVPLISVIAASNEEPEDDSLRALHDRLVFRTVVDYVKEPSNRSRMHQNFVAEMNGSMVNAKRTTITILELEAIRIASRRMPVNTSVYKSFAKLLNTLDKIGIVVSDRRQNECYRIMQGNALYCGRTQVVLDDFNALKSVLWEQKKDIPLVSAEIDKLVNPYDDEINNNYKKGVEVINKIRGITDPNDRCGASIEAKGRLEDLIKKMTKTINEANENGKDTTDMVKKRAYLTEENEKVVSDALGLTMSDLGLKTGISTGMPF